MLPLLIFVEPSTALHQVTCQCSSVHPCHWCTSSTSSGWLPSNVWKSKIQQIWRTKNSKRVMSVHIAYPVSAVNIMETPAAHLTSHLHCDSRHYTVHIRIYSCDIRYLTYRLTTTMATRLSFPSWWWWWWRLCIKSYMTAIHNSIWQQKTIVAGFILLRFASLMYGVCIDKVCFRLSNRQQSSEAVKLRDRWWYLYEIALLVLYIIVITTIIIIFVYQNKYYR